MKDKKINAIVEKITKDCSDFCNEWWKNQTEGYIPEVTDKIDIYKGDIEYFQSLFKKKISKSIKKTITLAFAEKDKEIKNLIDAVELKFKPITDVNANSFMDLREQIFKELKKELLK